MLTPNTHYQYHPPQILCKNIINHVKIIALLLCFSHHTVYAATPPDAASTATQPTATKPSSILTFRTGFSQANLSAIPISPKCPGALVPYVTISSSEFGKSDTVFAGRKVCVNSVIDIGSSYTANITVTSQTFSITATNNDRYVSDSDSEWYADLWNHPPAMPANDLISLTTTDAPNGYIYWTLYCYPAGTPAFSYTCP